MGILWGFGGVAGFSQKSGSLGAIWGLKRFLHRLPTCTFTEMKCRKSTASAEKEAGTPTDPRDVALGC